MAPSYWWSDDLLVLWGEDGVVAMWDVIGKRVVWKADDELVGGRRWDGSITTWRTATDLELRDPRIGQVQDTLKAIGPGGICGGLLICRPRELGDPVQAVRRDGTVVWQREVMPELLASQGTSTGEGSKKYLGIAGASSPGKVVLTYGNGCMACSLEDGTTLWRQPIRVPQHAPLEDGRIYAMDGQRFVVIDETTGKLLCDRTHEDLAALFRVKLGAVGGDLVVFTSESGHVVALDRSSGDLVLFECHYPRVAFWGAAVVNGRVLLSGDDGNLWVYEAA